MSVAPTELLMHKSANGASEGGAEITALVVSGVKNNIFAQVDDASRIAGGQQIRKWFLYNNAAADSLTMPSVYLSSPPINCTDVIGLGTAGSDDSDYTQGNMTAFTDPAFVAAGSSGSDVRTLHITGLDGAQSPAEEDLVLNGSAEVLSTKSWTVVYGVAVSAVDPTRVVAVREGSAGTVRGTIAATKKCCWLWLTPLSKGGGLRLPDLVAQTSYAFWEIVAWSANVSGVHPNNSTLAVEEN